MLVKMELDGLVVPRPDVGPHKVDYIIGKIVLEIKVKKVVEGGKPPVYVPIDKDNPPVSPAWYARFKNARGSTLAVLGLAHEGYAPADINRVGYFSISNVAAFKTPWPAIPFSDAEKNARPVVYKALSTAQLQAVMNTAMGGMLKHVSGGRQPTGASYDGETVLFQF